MSLNLTPSGERIHIGLFGNRNAGKSSLINAITGQQLAIVSDQKGTTTDPVLKSMELLPIGPVTIIDTPGLDDEGELGTLRIQKARLVLRKCDIALVVVDAQLGITEKDTLLWQEISALHIPALLVINKCDQLSEMEQAIITTTAMTLAKDRCRLVSSLTGQGIQALKDSLAPLLPQEDEKTILGDLLEPLDLVVLVTPIDSAAPKGRLILPQQLVLRDIIDHHALALVVQEGELKAALEKLNTKPRLVVTDSQVFAKVAKIVPTDVELTSFSILMARYKGTLKQAIKAARVLDNLTPQDKVLISEGCTHHRQCGDIGTEKLPHWIKNFTGITPEFHWTSGQEFPEQLSDYKLIIHCGGCMLNEKEMLRRAQIAQEQNIPMTNYGIAIAYMNGILTRTLAPLPGYAKLLF